MYRQGKLYFFAAAGFLYSTIIVDLFRKLAFGVNVEFIRNIVYIFFFSLLIYDMLKTRHFAKMLTLLIVMLVLFAFSYLLNPGYSSVYFSAVFLFISRLWPAYYIGRYTEDWEVLSKSIMKFSPIALFYALSLFIRPELASGIAYATIASNLAFVSMISFYASIYFKQYIWLPIVLVCLLPVFFLGTRVFFLGIIVSLLLAYIINTENVSQIKRFFLLFCLSVVGLVFLLFWDDIFHQLYLWFPDSRTLNRIATGDFMDDSNRSSDFYSRILGHISDNPLKMLGFLGDRILLSFEGDSTSEILSNFSHNVSLELCLNFGLPLGVLLNIFFGCCLIKALRRCFIKQYAINYIFVLVFGTCFINMMVSSSYLSDYVIWFLFGLAFNINKRSFLYKHYL